MGFEGVSHGTHNPTTSSIYVTDAEKELQYTLRVVMDGYENEWGRLMTLKDMLFRYCVLLHVRDPNGLANTE